MASLNERIIGCRACPRLVAWREQVATEKRKSYGLEEYWGRAVPNFGDPNADRLIVGLAPAAHGANRTGRMFTGDRSGDWLYRALFRADACNQPTSVAADDGLVLRNVLITAICHCAPPDNKPLPEELRNCRRYLRQEMVLLENVRVIVVLGRIAWQAVLQARRELGRPVPRPLPPFRHAACSPLDESTALICSYHPSQQNTSTGKLTRAMFDEVFRRARELIEDNKH